MYLWDSHSCSALWAEKTHEEKEDEDEDEEDEWQPHLGDAKTVAYARARAHRAHERSLSESGASV